MRLHNFIRHPNPSWEMRSYFIQMSFQEFLSDRRKEIVVKTLKSWPLTLSQVASLHIGSPTEAYIMRNIYLNSTLALIDYIRLRGCARTHSELFVTQQSENKRTAPKMNNSPARKTEGPGAFTRSQGTSWRWDHVYKPSS